MLRKKFQKRSNAICTCSNTKYCTAKTGPFRLILKCYVILVDQTNKSKEIKSLSESYFTWKVKGRGVLKVNETVPFWLSFAIFCNLHLNVSKLNYSNRSTGSCYFPLIHLKKKDYLYFFTWMKIRLQKKQRTNIKLLFSLFWPLFYLSPSNFSNAKIEQSYQ